MAGTTWGAFWTALSRGWLGLVMLLAAPASSDAKPPTRPPHPTCKGDPPPGDLRPGGERQEQAMSKSRERMVTRQLKRRDIRDVPVLDAMGKVPRHRFVKRSQWSKAYADHPLPLGCSQTVSQPYIVALMTQLVRPRKGMKALDIGTGSGYQAAVLAEIVDHVYSVEIIFDLADNARARLKTLGYKNVTVRCGDGFAGWKEHGPYDVIVVAAAPAQVPQPLIDQLAPGGR